MASPTPSSSRPFPSLTIRETRTRGREIHRDPSGARVSDGASPAASLLFFDGIRRPQLRTHTTEAGGGGGGSGGGGGGGARCGRPSGGAAQSPCCGASRSAAPRRAPCCARSPTPSPSRCTTGFATLSEIRVFCMKLPERPVTWTTTCSPTAASTARRRPSGRWEQELEPCSRSTITERPSRPTRSSTTSKRSSCGKAVESSCTHQMHNSIAVWYDGSPTGFRCGLMMVILFYLDALVPYHRANGCNSGKKIMVVRIIKHVMEIIHLLTDANSIQIIVDAIIHRVTEEAMMSFSLFPALLWLSSESGMLFI